MGQAGAGNQHGQVNNRTRRSGQILGESRRVTGAEPGGSPSRSTATTLTDHWCVAGVEFTAVSGDVLEHAALSVEFTAPPDAAQASSSTGGWPGGYPAMNAGLPGEERQAPCNTDFRVR